MTPDNPENSQHAAQETVPKIKDGPLKDWPEWVSKLPVVTLTQQEIKDLPEYSCTLPDSYKRPISEGGRPWKRDLNFYGLFGSGPKFVRCEYIPHEDPKFLGIKNERIEITGQRPNDVATESAEAKDGHNKLLAQVCDLRAELAKVQGEQKIAEELRSEEIDARMRFAELLGIKECRAYEIEDGINSLLADRLALRTALTHMKDNFQAIIHQSGLTIPDAVKATAEGSISAIDRALSSTAGELRGVLVRCREALKLAHERALFATQARTYFDALAALSRFLPPTHTP